MSSRGVAAVWITIYVMKNTATAVSRRTVLSLVFSGTCALCQDTEQTSAWKVFAEWIATLDARSLQQNTDNTLASYKTKLMQGEASAAEADLVIAQLNEYMVGHPSAFQAVAYNRIYESGAKVFTAEPTAFLSEVVKPLHPGKALDLGMGDGRNAVFLAQQGWEVLGIDLSEVGISRARERATRLGVKITALVQDADQFDYGSNRWDLVCIIYFSGYNFVRDLEKRVAASLRPGGHVVTEGPSGTPKGLLDRWVRWEPLGFNIIRLEYRAEKAEWGQSSFGRMLIQKRVRA